MNFIGFDLGDGESAIAFLPQDSEIEPRIIPVSGSGSFLSAVGLRGRDIVVGEAAATMEGISDFQVRFKSRYLTDPEGSARTLSLFARGVVQHLVRESQLEDTAVTVGCPAGWGSHYRRMYQELLTKAGLPEVSVVSESRAAFIYARYARDVAVDPALFQKSVLVIDLGSSTLDFAHIVNGRETGLEDTFGDVRLGGGVIDAALLEQAVSSSLNRRAIESVFRESGSWRNYCELTARRVKERYFTSESAYETASCDDTVLICYSGKEKLRISVNKKTMDNLLDKPLELLGQRSFRRCLRDALENAALLTKNAPPKLVMLTGGASRMSFFREQCKETFPGAVMVCCPEPEYSVARGLAYVGRVDHRMAMFRKAVEDFSGGDEVKALVSGDLPQLLPPVCDALSAMLLEQAAQPLVRMWREGSIDTLEELNSMLRKKSEAILSSPQAQSCIAKPVADWTAGLCREMQKSVNDICRKYDVPLAQMDILQVRADTKAELSFSVENTSGFGVAGTVMGAVVSVVIGLLCGGTGLALIASGPLGFFAGLLIGALVSVVGWDRFKAAASRRSLPLPLRRIVTDSSVTSDEQRRKLSAGLVKAFSDSDSGFFLTLSDSIVDALNHDLNEMARRVEMPVQTTDE